MSRCQPLLAKFLALHSQLFPKMVLPAMAVGVLCLVKSGAVMGTYSCKNYDENIKSAWEKENSLPGTDGIPREVIPRPPRSLPCK